MRSLNVISSENVEHLISGCEQVVRDDSTMTSDGAALGMAKFTQSHQSGLKILAHRVISVIVEAGLDGRAIDVFYASRRTEGKRYGGGLSSSTMGNLHRLLSLILKSAVKAKKLAASPIDDVQTKPRAKTKKIEVLSEAELAALLAHLKSGPLYLPALLSANTGLRRGEVCGLRWCDLDLAKGTLHVAQQVQNIGGELVTLVPKTDRSRRTIRVPVTVMSALKEHRKAQAELRLQLGLGKDTLDLVFADALGRRLDPDAFSKNFAAEAAAIKRVTFHTLRHTHITHLLRDSVPVHVVSARAGHSNC